MIAPSKIRERILLIGTFGTGKSEAWYKIAEWHRKSKPTARFFIGDSDRFSADRILEEYGDGTEIKMGGLVFRQYGNCYVYDLDEWDSFMAFVKFASENALPDDWTIVDMIGAAWTRVQDSYTDMVYGKDIVEFYVEKKRKNVTEGGKPAHAMADAYGSNWQVINKMYGAFTQLLLRNRGHVLACTPAEKIGEKEEGDVVREYGKFGYKPVGQKHMGHLFHTVLLLQQGQKGWSFSTLRDRKREGKTAQPLSDFVLNYLVGVAGWKLGEEETNG